MLLRRPMTFKMIVVLIGLVLSVCVSCDMPFDFEIPSDEIPSYIDADYVFAVSEDIAAEGSYAYLRLNRDKTFVLIQVNVNPELVFWGKYRFETNAYEFSRASGSLSFYDVDSNNTNVANALLSDVEGTINEYIYYWYLNETGAKRIELQSLDHSVCENLMNGRQVLETEFESHLPEDWSEKII